MKDLIEGVKALLTFLFGENVPSGVQDAVGVLLAGAFIVLLLYGIVIGFGKAAKVIREDIRPIFYNELERRRAERRRQFAEHIKEEMQRIDAAEDWGDYKYAELEANVRMRGQRRVFGFWPRQTQLRRERSLSVALRNSREKLVLLEGEPGSGKSVALHYLTSTMARTAAKASSASTVIPLYVDLKSIEREAGREIDAALIGSHVVKTLNRTGDLAITEFLDEELRKGMQEGTWLFLFDSFDEIPDILSVTSADSTIREYGLAIYDFLAGFNRCRGVVASRSFRGPGALNWPRFEITPLSDRNRRNLIKRADLPPEVERALIGEVELARSSLTEMSGNPLFLGLLCEYMRDGHSFPENAYAVFENYVTARLNRDEQKLHIQFGVATEDVRHAAEVAAFCMAASAGLGLSPARGALAAAMEECGFAQDAGVMLDAMAYIKLARAEEHDRAHTFTFTHRRFQEYFATCVVMKRAGAVSPDALLTDARWRETAVVLLQTQNAPALLDAAGTRLAEALTRIREAFRDHPLPEDVESVKAGPREAIEFPWPPLALHLLALLQAGFRGRSEAVPEPIRATAGRILLPVAQYGSLMDRRWALEVAGAAPQPVLTLLLHDAYASGSSWLGETAYWQAGMLRSIDEEIARPIRYALVKLFLDGRLLWQKHATRAHLMRLPDSATFLNILRLLLVVVPVDLAIHVALIAIALASPASRTGVALATILIALSYPLVRLGARRFLKAVLPAMFFLRFLAVLALTVDRPALTLVALSASLWSTCAVLAAAAGQFTSPVWWPFLPLFPFVYPFRNARQIVAQRIKGVDRDDVTGWVGGIALLLSLGFLGSRSDRLGALLAAGCSTITGVMLIAGVVSTLYFLSRDAVHLYRCRNRATPWTGADVAKAVARFNGEKVATSFIRSLRQRCAIDPSHDNEQQVRDYAIAYEQMLNAQPTRDAEKIVLLDELNMLAEHLRTQRSGR
jgi:hypothetical protein